LQGALSDQDLVEVASTVLNPNFSDCHLHTPLIAAAFARILLRKGRSDIMPQDVAAAFQIDPTQLLLGEKLSLVSL
jgi:hypothetical protein